MALTKIPNPKLKVNNKKKRNREEIIEQRKTKDMAAKRQKTRGGIRLSSKKQQNYKSDLKDKTNPDLANEEYLLQL